MNGTYYFDNILLNAFMWINTCNSNMCNNYVARNPTNATTTIAATSTTNQQTTTKSAAVVNHNNFPLFLICYFILIFYLI